MTRTHRSSWVGACVMERTMSYRDDCLIDSPEDAKDWLERYRDTITDPQVLKVIEVMEGFYDENYEEEE